MSQSSQTPTLAWDVAPSPLEIAIAKHFGLSPDVVVAGSMRGTVSAGDEVGHVSVDLVMPADELVQMLTEHRR